MRIEISSLQVTRVAFYFNIPEAMKSEMRLKDFFSFAGENINIFGLCSTQIVSIEITILVQDFRMINSNLISSLSFHFHLYPTYQVLPEVDHLLPFRRFKYPDRVKCFMFLDRFIPGS